MSATASPVRPAAPVRFLAQPEVAAAAAYMHGLAGAMASGSEQRGWHRPHLYGHAGKTPASAIGHPIVAGDVVAAVPRAFGELLR